MTLDELLKHQPPERRIDGARTRIRERLEASRRVLAVLDDDPTGTQVAHDVDVYTAWSEATLAEAFAAPAPAFFLSTNSRSLPGDEAAALARSTARALDAAARAAGKRVLPASRSDSTLRGHFAEEVYALADTLPGPWDGVIVAPAFFEGGRYTVDDVHWVVQGGKAVPAHETEFARDPAFGFSTAHLPTWIEEKTGGRMPADRALIVSIEMLRGEGPEAVADLLAAADRLRPVVVNAASYADLEVFVLGLQEAEERGKRFLYRSAASFVKVRAGIPDRPLLEAQELAADGGPGLVVAGSYVQRTSRQLDRLLACPGVAGVEVAVDRLLDAAHRDDEIRRATDAADAIHAADDTAVLFTSRAPLTLPGERFLEAGSAIMDGLCRIVRGLARRPSFVIAKGGITSHRLATEALDTVRARVLGQAAPGVPVWRLGDESRMPRVLYVVFPGNVGTDDTLAEVYLKFAQGGAHEQRQEDRLHHPHERRVRQ